MLTAAQTKAVEAAIRRKAVRSDLGAWCKHIGFNPAKHHQLLIDVLQKASRRQLKQRKVMVMMPPGSAKSTYSSVAFPPWYLGDRPTDSILACSYSYTLIETFGKRCRNLVENNATMLGYGLSKHSQAAGEWETTKGGRYFCAGVGAGLAGHRADFGLIDDYLGSEEDANSKLIRDKQWDWYHNDFWPRLKPDAIVVIVANRRHEDDLIGRLLESEADEWLVIRIPFFAEDGDPLGRSVGERLWPEWFTEEMATSIRRKSPRTVAGLYQQRPAPEEGNFFQRAWFEDNSYGSLAELPDDLRIYSASDHAVSERQTADRTCLLPVGIDTKGDIWVLPDVWWKVAGPKEVVDAWLEMLRRRQPLTHWAEKGHISKSIGPFLRDRMDQERVYVYIDEVTPARDKQTRAGSIHGMASMGKIHLPRFASWFEAALHELLTFPGGKHDDFVDTLAHVGMGLAKMTKAQPSKTVVDAQPSSTWRPTIKWLKESAKMANASTEKYGGR